MRFRRLPRRGTCAEETTVAYLAANGTGTACTSAAPCGDLKDAVDTDRHIFKVDGAIIDDNVVVFQTGSTAIYSAANASVTRNSFGNIIEVDNAGTELAIHGLRIFGATGTGAGNGIYTDGQGNPKITLDRVMIDSNDGSGIRAPDGGDITVTRSVIANNTGNQGVFLQNATFSITNTVIAQNGKTTLGHRRRLPVDAARSVEVRVQHGRRQRLDRRSTAFRGITCSPGVAIANNIITGNEANGCTSPTRCSPRAT